VTIRVPPLRERRPDLAALIEHFLKRFTEANQRDIHGYSENSTMLCCATISRVTSGNWRILLKTRWFSAVAATSVWLTFRPTSRLCRPTACRLTFRTGDPPELVTRIEKEKILEALERHEYVQTRAAENLGIHERVLRYKMKKYGLEGPMVNFDNRSERQLTPARH